MGNNGSTSAASVGAIDEHVETELPSEQRAATVQRELEFVHDMRNGMVRARDTLGDHFLLKSLGQDVAGFCGPVMLAEYEAHEAAGRIARGAATPPGLHQLFGRILSMMDGEAHAQRKAALLVAFEPAHIAAYAPVIRKVVESAHASWVAKESVISLALESNRLVFKISLVVLLGVTDDIVEPYRLLFQDFSASWRRSFMSADPLALACRKRVIAELLMPALEASKARVKENRSLPCALDVLVAQTSLTDEELLDESFHFLFAGGGTQCLVTNTITAGIVFTQAREKLLAARDAFFVKYPCDDDRWAHLNDLGYMNDFLREVKRFYVAGLTETFGRVTEDFAVTTPDGVVNVPKGALAVAGLEATSKHPRVWANPATFDPDRFATHHETGFSLCPHGFGSHRNRRCAGESLAHLILQSSLLSLLHYTWQMVPSQSYELDQTLSTPVPLGQLMAHHFHRRTEGNEDMEFF
ncbi:cytochrome P450 [Achlya hypogyna]|uniref:Cytochrome P450 n=1 Tax=Achlya hypogyna TaxID=1202772 RepID=A0A1V9YGK9_ACHHY|nr:cytochrome P450 [Achlya hypogyna]